MSIFSVRGSVSSKPKAASGGLCKSPKDACILTSVQYKLLPILNAGCV